MIKKVFNKTNILIIILITLLTINFMTNFLSDSKISLYTFENFQFDSENLVLEKINYDKNPEPVGICKYGLCKYERNPDTNQPEFIPYESQLGLQGYVISFLHNNLKIKLNSIYIIVSFLFAAVLTSISYLLTKKYDKLLGIVFYLTFFLSPWIIGFARNLYWVPFTWFLPMLLGLILSRNYKKTKVFVPLIFLSILIKCLCGYEYITTIMLSTIMFFIIDFFTEKNSDHKKRIFKTIIIVGIACLLGFFIALCMHGYIRGDGNILEGVKTIYKNDVLRRTILTIDSNKYDGVIKESIDSNIFTVLNIYCFNWDTDIVYGISNIWFFGIIFTSFVICIFNIVNQTKNGKQTLIFYIICLLSTISWFILGKSHSYIHRHMNFVLWYFGYVQVCLYIIINFLKQYIMKSRILFNVENKKQKK